LSKQNHLKVVEEIKHYDVDLPYIAVALSNQSQVRLYSLKDQSLTFQNLIGDGNSDSPISCVRFHNPSPKNKDGLYLLYGDNKGDINIWNINLGWVRLLKGHDQPILCIRAIGEMVASSSADATVKIWSFQNRNCLRTLKDVEQTPFDSLVLKDDVVIAAAKAQRVVRSWDCFTGELAGLNNGDTPVDMDLKENKLAVLSFDHFTIWNVYSYYIYQVLRPSEFSSTRIWNFLSIAYDGKTSVYTTTKGLFDSLKLCLWDFSDQITIPGLEHLNMSGSYTTTRLASITATRKLRNVSFEELRWKYYQTLQPAKEEKEKDTKDLTPRSKSKKRPLEDSSN